MRCVPLTIAVLLAFAAPLFAAGQSFEILLARPLPGDTANTWLVILDGGYADGLEEGMTAVAYHGPERTPHAEITIEIADRHESFGLAHPRTGIDPDTLAKACGEHCVVSFEVPPADTALYQQKAIAAMGEADFERAKYFLSLLIDAGDTRPSIQNALARCDRAIAADSSGLPTALVEAELARVPLYEYLLAHYFGECRFERAADIVSRIDRVDPDNETAAAYSRALRRIAAIAADSDSHTITNLNPGPIKTETPHLVVAVDPMLPESLQNADPAIRATVAVLVDESGSVAKATMKRSTGQSSVDNAIINAAYKTVWRPAIHSGLPVAAFGTWDVTIGSPSAARKMSVNLEVLIEDSGDFRPADDAYVPVEVYPEMIYEHKPDYPVLEEQRRITGTVWVKALVGEKGKVLEAAVYKSSGNAQLDQAAVEAAEKCRYKPALKDKQPVRVWVHYKVEFRLDRQQ